LFTVTVPSLEFKAVADPVISTFRSPVTVYLFPSEAPQIDTTVTVTISSGDGTLSTAALIFYTGSTLSKSFIYTPPVTFVHLSTVTLTYTCSNQYALVPVPTVITLDRIIPVQLNALPVNGLKAGQAATILVEISEPVDSSTTMNVILGITGGSFGSSSATIRLPAINLVFTGTTISVPVPLVASNNGVTQIILTAVVSGNGATHHFIVPKSIPVIPISKPATFTVSISNKMVVAAQQIVTVKPTEAPSTGNTIQLSITVNNGATISVSTLTFSSAVAQTFVLTAPTLPATIVTVTYTIAGGTDFYRAPAISTVKVLPALHSLSFITVTSSSSVLPLDIVTITVTPSVAPPDTGIVKISVIPYINSQLQPQAYTFTFTSAGTQYYNFIVPGVYNGGTIKFMYYLTTGNDEPYYVAPVDNTVNINTVTKTSITVTSNTNTVTGDGYTFITVTLNKIPKYDVTVTLIPVTSSYDSLPVNVTPLTYTFTSSNALL
jgi:hypothetical protein